MTCARAVRRVCLLLVVGMISHYCSSSTALSVSVAAGWEPGRLRVMLLASGIPIRTILINQSLKYASNLKPRYSLSKKRRAPPRHQWGVRLLAPVRCLFMMSAKDTWRPVTLRVALEMNLTTGKLFSPSARLSHWGGKKMLSSCTEGSWATCQSASCCMLVHVLRVGSLSSAHV